MLVALIAFQVIRITSMIGSGFECPYDDTFISLRYARNLVEGEGLVFNQGERVEGFSCFLWVMICSAAIAFGANGPIFSAIATIVLASVNIVLCWWAGARLLAADENVKSAARLLCCLMMIAPLYLAYAALSGMETELYAVLLLLGTVLLYDELTKKGKSSFLSGLVFALLALTRPEGVFCFAFLLLWFIGMGVVREKRLGLHSARGLVRAASVVFGTFVSYLVFRIMYYGEILPNTHYAKVELGWLNLHAWAFNVTKLAEDLGWLLILLPLAFIRPQTRRFAAFLIGPVVFAVLSSISVGGTFGGGGHRLFVPYLFLVGVLCAQGIINIAYILQRALRIPFGNVALPLVMVCACALLVPQNTQALKHVYHARSNARGAKLFFQDKAKDEMRALGEWLRENVPSDFWIATDRIGKAPFYSRLHTIDMFGLTEPAIARRTVPKGSPQYAPAELYPVSHTMKKDWEYTLQMRPQLIIDIIPLSPQLAIRILDLYCQSAVALPDGRVVELLLRRDLDGAYGLSCKPGGLSKDMIQLGGPQRLDSQSAP